MNIDMDKVVNGYGVSEETVFAIIEAIVGMSMMHADMVTTEHVEGWILSEMNNKHVGEESKPMVLVNEAWIQLAKQTSLANVKGMRDLMKVRGKGWGEIPLCDFCDNWMATHVQGEFFVCDKTKCQDAAQATIEKENEAMAYININRVKAINNQDQADKELKIGDHVKDKSGVYLGKITAMHVRVMADVQRNDHPAYPYDISELALAERLTPEQAWTEATLSVMRTFTQKGNVLSEGEQRQIRHDFYVILGSAGVKVTDEVKERVREIIRQVAVAMYTYLDN